MLNEILIISFIEKWTSLKLYTRQHGLIEYMWWGHYTKNHSLTIVILIGGNCILLHWIQSYIIRSLQNFAHGMTAVLSCHVHHFVMITMQKLFRGLGQIFIKLKILRKIFSVMCLRWGTGWIDKRPQDGVVCCIFVTKHLLSSRVWQLTFGK